MATIEKSVTHAEMIFEQYRQWTCALRETPATLLVDLLADLLTWAHQEGIDFAPALAMATLHHTCEIAGEG